MLCCGGQPQSLRKSKRLKLEALTQQATASVWQPDLRSLLKLTTHTHTHTHICMRALPSIHLRFLSLWAIISGLGYFPDGMDDLDLHPCSVRALVGYLVFVRLWLLQLVPWMWKDQDLNPTLPLPPLWIHPLLFTLLPPLWIHKFSFWWVGSPKSKVAPCLPTGVWSSKLWLFQ